MFALYGHGVGTGIAIGTARLLRAPTDQLPCYTLTTDQIEAEIARLGRAVTQAHAQLHKIAATVSNEAHGDEVHDAKDGAHELRAILAAHQQILADPALITEPSAIIRTHQINAEAALQQYAEQLDMTFQQVDDPYLRGKAADIAQVVQRIHGELLEAPDELSAQPAGAYDGEIIVANDLAPADTIALKNHRIRAFITNLGGPISHTAILARSMKIPAIVGLHGGTRYLRTGDVLIIDGKRGVVLVGADAAALVAYRKRREKIRRRDQQLATLSTARAVTLDGLAIELHANIELPDEIHQSILHNADGVGLYRTEFLYMNRAQLPDEEEQYAVYRALLRQTSRPVTIRSVDLGADKQVDGGRASDASITNPALGRRAIRLCLHDLSLFKPQLRAIYRAAVHGQARLLIPMLSNMDELAQLFFLIDEVKQELQAEGRAYAADLPLGGMVEVPAAAVAADLFAARLDFLSLGTNDLIQYTLAIDRVDDAVNYLYDPLHPAVLRLIKTTITAARAANIAVSICGEMAGDTRYTRVLLGLGLRVLSMHPAAILAVKQQIRLTDTSRCTDLVTQLLHTGEQQARAALLTKINR